MTKSETKLPGQTGRYITVFISGAAVLALEILAGRFMVPAFGTSVFIWGAVLSVTLVCLAIGYRWGGVVAERPNPEARMVFNMVLAAGWIAITPIFGNWLLDLGLWAGQLAGPVVVVIGLFGVPLTLLATVVPLIFGDALQKGAKEPAKTVSNLFAVSTIGSVLGALLTAYVGVPVLGISRSFFVTAASVFALALPRAFKGVGTTATILVFASVELFRLIPADLRGAPTFADGIELLHSVDTRYGHLDVLEDVRDGSRIMVIDGASQSWAQGPDWLASRYRYVEMVMRQVERYELAKGRALILGVGAGTLIRQLREAGFTIDGVEIDLAVINAGKQFFGLRDDDATFHLQDGRSFVETLPADTRYDLIVADVAGGGYQPEHIYNLDAYLSMKRHLTKTGALVLNLVTLTSPPDRVTRYQTSSMRLGFNSVEVIDLMPPPGSNSGLSSVLIIGTDRAPKVAFRGQELERLLELNEILPPVTDDWNPIALWSTKANAEWHKDIRVWLGDAAVYPW